MIKNTILLLVILLGFENQAQVGINTTTPKAQLEIKSSNEATPANTDGLLIPKINAFPVTNPTADQQGMLVYLTTAIGANTPGFYYWNNPTTAWLPVKGTDGGTLDQAYDFGGAGNGRTITADTGAVTIAGTDGLVSTGTIGSGAVAPSGAGTRMVWNPRKAAFRAGSITGTGWNDANIGQNSVAFGDGTIASGNFSTAFGSFATASGAQSVSFGTSVVASGDLSTAFGAGTLASGSTATSFGNGTTASGGASTAFGNNNTASGGGSTAFGTLNTASGLNTTTFGVHNGASSYGETVIGIGATTYTPSTNGATQFRTANATDRLFVIGNAIDANNNSSVDATERSDAMVVLKNGNIGIGTSNPFSKLHLRFTPTLNNIGPTLTIEANQSGSAANVSFRNNITGNMTSMGMLANGDFGIHQGCNFGGCVIGVEVLRIKPNGNIGIGTTNALDKLHVQGNIRMVDGNQGVGNVLTSDANGTATWTAADSIASGTLDQAYDFGAAGAGRTITADTGAVTIDGTDGLVSTGTIGSGASAPSGAGTRMVWNPRRAAFRVGHISGTQWDAANIGLHSTAFGLGNLASGSASVAFGAQNQASGGASVAYGGSNQASGESSIAAGHANVTSGHFSVAIGSIGAANGTRSISLGHNTIAQSWGEIALGIGNTDYTPSTNGATEFTAANQTDRLLVVGNAIDTNNNGVLDSSERRDAMVVLKNGNAGLGVSAPGERLQVAGKSLFTNGFSADNAALVYRNNTDYMFIGPQSGSSADGGAMALFGSTNTSGGNAGGVDFNVPGSQVRMNHTNGSYTFRANSTSGYAATFEINDTGLEIRHNSASRAFVFSPNSTERMRLTPGGFLGIGTTAPARKLHVSNGVSGGASNANTGILLESSGNVYQHYLAPSTNESGMLFGSELSSINGGIIFNNSLANNGIQFRTGGNTNRMTITSVGNVGIGTTAPGGQFELSLNEGRKPTSNTWTIPSDARLKNVDGVYQKGLSEILQLKPIRYHYKNTDKKSFESEVLEKEAYGFLAQEVQQIFPEAVGTDADGYLNFDLHPILVAYTNAFKELNVKNKAVEDKNRTLELQLKSQEQIINTLIERLEKLEAKN